MIKVHILTAGFVSPNGRAFLFPLLMNRAVLLNNYKIQIVLFTSVTDAIFECDVLLIESKYYQKYWQTDTDWVLSQIQKFKDKINKILYFNINDSSSWDHARVLPYVDGYYANQLLKDRSLYLKPLYGNRIFTDYYHRTQNIHDRIPEMSEPVLDDSLLKKIHVGWNSGLADYSMMGLYLMELYKRFPLLKMLRYPKRIAPPSKNRPIDFSCRMGVSYARQTVAWQRLEIKKILRKRVVSKKLSRFSYFQEMKSSKIIVSPFGLGEITLKDFEAFLTGGLILKPDMSHMETWPDFFRSGETIISHGWQLDDFEEILDNAVRRYTELMDIAIAGQKYYCRYTCGKDAPYLFGNHFNNIIRPRGDNG